MAVLAPPIAARGVPASFAAVGPVLTDGVLVIDGPKGELLYGLVSGPSHTDATGIADAIRDAFAEPNRTVTSRLVTAFQEANRARAAEFRRLLPRDRARLDVGCLVLRGSDAFVTLAGNVRGYVIRDGELYDVGDGTASPAIGDDDPEVPNIVRVQIGLNDIVLLAGGELLNYAPPERIGAWFAHGLEDGVEWLRASLRDALPIVVFQAGGRPARPKSRLATFIPATDAESSAGPLSNVPVQAAIGGVATAMTLSAQGLWAVASRFVPTGGTTSDDVVEEVVVQRRHRRWTTRPALVAIGLAAAVALIAIGAVISTLLGGDRSDVAFGTALNDARRSLEAVAASTDPVTSRQRLREAQFAIDRAIAIRKEDASAKQVQQNIAGEVAKLDKIIKLTGQSVVSELPGTRNPTGLVVDGGNGYVLDDSAWGVRRIGLEPNKPADAVPVAAKGTRSDADPMADPVAMSWLGATENKTFVGLLMIDNERDLYIQPSGKPLQQLVVRDSQRWSSVRAIKGYAGNLYVLDPKANQVWRYVPNYLGFDTEMKGILDGATIDDARDFAIDGDIYVVTAAGKIWRFTNGVGKEFDLRPLDRPIANPVAIVTGATAHNVYIADAANDRIVVFDKDGRFQRQIVSDTFSDLRAIAVDEAQGKLYFLANKKLYRATLPK